MSKPQFHRYTQAVFTLGDGTVSPAYLVRQDSSWCFRIRIPRDLQKLIAKKELRYSLKTGSKGEAKYLARRAAGQVQWIFRRLRQEKHMVLKELPDTQVQEIINKSIKQALDDEEEGIIERSRPMDESVYKEWIQEPEIPLLDISNGWAN